MARILQPKSNTPVLMGNACQRSPDFPLSASRLFSNQTAALPGYNTTLAYTLTDLEKAESERLATGVGNQQYFVVETGMFGIGCFTPIIGTAATLASSADSDRKWIVVRAFGFKFRFSDTPAQRVQWTKAEPLWEIAFRTSQLAIPDGHIAIPATRPAALAYTWAADLTFKVNTSTENVVDLTRGDGVRKRGEVADGALSVEFDVADYDAIVFAGTCDTPSGEDGGDASSWSGVFTGL